MVSYHQNRIEQSYIPALRASFKAYDAGAVHGKNDTNASEDSSALDATISGFRNLLFESNIEGTSILEKYARLVIASYDLRRTRKIEEALYTSPSATSKAKNLWINICLFARLRVAFQKFKEITLILPSFQKVTIILVPRPLPPAKPSQKRLLNLKQTFDILKLDLSPATTKAVLGRSRTIGKIESEFAKRQRQKLNVHAEVQMLMFLNPNESSTTALFPYLGCSKLSCFMCDRFIRSYGRLTTRGCHGHLFKPWTVASVDRLPPDQADRTAKALIRTQKEVKKELKASIEGHIRHERTSVIGGSSVLSVRQEERSQRQLQIDHLRMKAERDRVGELFRR